MSSPTPSKRRQRRDELANTSLRGALKPSSAGGAAVLTGALLVVLWVVVMIDAIDEHRLLRFGIKPRELGGLTGIVSSPFLHADAGQLAANSLPIAVLTWLMLTSAARYFGLVTAGAALVSGLAGWLAGPTHSVLLGASGILFGWLGYLLARAWFGRRIKWIAIAIGLLALFSGMFTGLLPRLHHNVFWGGQLAGFLTGVLVAALLHRRNRRDRRTPGIRGAPRRPGPAVGGTVS